MSRSLFQLRRDALHFARAALAAADPASLVVRALADDQVRESIHGRRVRIVAAGKAAVPMTAALVRALEADVRGGVVAGPNPPEASVPAPLEWFHAGHPLPNRASEAAGRAAISQARALEPGETLLVALSGGASALLSVPVDGLPLADKIEAVRVLLAAGADIHALNCVRKHLSAVKGGRLAAEARAPAITLALSDVVTPMEDDPAVIGSGPTAADPTTFSEAIRVIDRLRVRAMMPAAAVAVLERGASGQLLETPKPGDPALERSRVVVIGGRRDAMAGAARAAAARGYHVEVLEPAVTGESREAARRHALEVETRLETLLRPACVISSGETTVRVVGGGIGGRNLELVLAWTEFFRATAAWVMIGLGTDGVDGPTDAAGAIADATTIERARVAGLGAPARFLEANDSYAFFEALGDLVKTGPTGTNVGDLQIVLAV